MINIDKGYYDQSCNESKVNKRFEGRPKLEKCAERKSAAYNFHKRITERYWFIAVATSSFKPEIA
jgi:hypothetical protein